MILSVYNQYLNAKTKELESSGPILVAGIVEGKLSIEGELPSPLKDYVSIEDINGLNGKEAIEMFYILAASNYLGYSKVSLEGIDENDVRDYILNNFTSIERLAITRGINPKRVFDRYA